VVLGELVVVNLLPVASPVVVEVLVALKGDKGVDLVEVVVFGVLVARILLYDPYGV